MVSVVALLWPAATLAQVRPRQPQSAQARSAQARAARPKLAQTRSAQARAAQQPAQPRLAQAEQAPASAPAAPAPAADLRVRPRVGAGYTSPGGGANDFGQVEVFLPVMQQPGQGVGFLQGRLLLDTTSELGASLLMGYRAYNADQRRIYGGYLGYDHRNTGESAFHQLGLGLESLGEIWDFRINGYLPLGDTRREIDRTVVGSSVQQSGAFGFRGNFLEAAARSQRLENRTFESALAAVDVEAGARIAKLNDQGGDVRAYGGVYYLSGQGTESTLGFRFRVASRPLDNLALGFGVQHDGIFGTQVLFNAQLSFPGVSPQGPLAPDQNVLARLGETVDRQSMITVDRQREQRLVVEDATIRALNPATNQPWFFTHATPGTTGSGGTGTAEAPFRAPSLQPALAATPTDGNGIVYVQAGSTPANNPSLPAFTIPDNVQVLSSGPVQTVPTQTGTQQLPKSGSGVLPITDGPIVMGNNTAIAGFDIIPNRSNGIQATNVSNLTIRDNRISLGQAAGIDLTNVGGIVTIERNQIEANDFEGIAVQNSGNTTARVTIRNNSISNNGGSGLYLRTADLAQVTADIQTNTIVSGFPPGVPIEAFTSGAVIESQTTGTGQLCLNLANNTSDSGYQLTTMSGNFNVVSLGQIGAINTGAVQTVSLPGQALNSVTNCP